MEYIFGIHTILATLKNSPKKIVCLHLKENINSQKIASILEEAKKNSVPVEYVPLKTLLTWVGDVTHQGVVASYNEERQYDERELKNYIQSTPNVFILILDGVQDPYNLGACLRTADAAGVDLVIVPKDKAVGLTPIVRKAASGASESMPFFQVVNLARTITTLKEEGVWIYGASEEAKTSIYQTNLKGPIAIVMGAEGSGLRRLTKEYCDGLLSISMQGTVSSLNVSVATGIILYEAVRQRKFS